MTRLAREFFLRDTITVAKDLLGCLLVHEANGRRVSGKIVEVEVYTGWDDTASHASRGITPRNAVMFGPPGRSYIYLIYGMHWLLNVVAKPLGADYGAAVLFRALEPVEGLDIMSARRKKHKIKDWTSGPGKLSAAMGLDNSLNDIDLTAKESPLYIEKYMPPGFDICRGPRVGINVDEPWLSLPHRFWIKGSGYVSRGK